MTLTSHQSVLVAEDSDEDYETVEEAARGAGLAHPLRRASTGDTCLELLRGGPAGPLRPAVVLLDLNMPGMDGRQALVAIRADPTLRDLPVVVLSTSANPRDVAYCYAHGANAYHVKPVRHGEHLRMLQDLFHYWLASVVLPEAGRP